MTQAIIITAIIVGGVVGLAWLLLHYAFKAWKAERSEPTPEGLVVRTPVTFDIHTTPASAEQAAARAYERIQQYPFSTN